MIEIKAEEMTKELQRGYEAKAAKAAKELSLLEADIADLEKRLKKTPSAFFESTVLAKWRKDAERLENEVKEMRCCANTVQLFGVENASLMAGVTVDRDVVLGNKPPPDYDEFWLGVDKFIAAQNASHSQARNEKHASPQGGDLEWDV